MQPISGIRAAGAVRQLPTCSPRRWLSTLAALAILATLFLVPSRALARYGTDYDQYGEVARIVSSRGDAFVRGNYQGDWGYVDENLVLEEGDEVLTGASGRLTVEFDNGVYLTLGPRSRALISRLAPGPTIRLRYGSFNVSLVDDLSGYDRARVQWPDGSLLLDQRGSYRVDVFRDGLARVAVLRGGAIVQASGGRRLVDAGEEVYIEPGGFPTREAGFRSGDYDEFDRFILYRFLNGVSSPLPRFLSGYNVVGLRDLMRFGDWSYVPEWRSYAWRPRTVNADWRPYRDGRWVYTRLGWTWVPDEEWCYAPSHYGRWGFVPNRGWMWKPEKRYSPAWVRFTQVGDRIGWAPIDPYGRLAANPRGREWWERSPFVFTQMDTMKNGRHVKIDPPKVKPEKVVVVDEPAKIVIPTSAAKVKAPRMKRDAPDPAAVAAQKAEENALKARTREETQARKEAEALSTQADKAERRRDKATQEQVEKPPATEEPKPAKQPRPEKAVVPDEPKPERGAKADRRMRNAPEETGFAPDEQGAPDEVKPVNPRRFHGRNADQEAPAAQHMRKEGQVPSHDEAGDFREQHGKKQDTYSEPMPEAPPAEGATQQEAKPRKGNHGNKNGAPEETAAPSEGNGEAPPADVQPEKPRHGNGGGNGN